MDNNSLAPWKTISVNIAIKVIVKYMCTYPYNDRYATLRKHIRLGNDENNYISKYNGNTPIAR